MIITLTLAGLEKRGIQTRELEFSSTNPEAQFLEREYPHSSSRVYLTGCAGTRFGEFVVRVRIRTAQFPHLNQEKSVVTAVTSEMHVRAHALFVAARYAILVEQPPSGGAFPTASDQNLTGGKRSAANFLTTEDCKHHGNFDRIAGARAQARNH